MATDLVEKINPEEPQPEVLERAAAAVRRGKVAAHPHRCPLQPLVGRPLQPGRRGPGLQPKGREPHRSLPILVGDIMMAEELASELSNRFCHPAAASGPGRLTSSFPPRPGSRSAHGPIPAAWALRQRAQGRPTS